MKEKLALTIDGIDWQGWLSCQVSRNLEAIAGGFALGLSFRWYPGQKALPVAAGSACTLVSSGDPLVTGFIDTVRHSLDSAAHSITAEGRDASGDLVDCAAVHKPGQWHGVNARQIAEILAKPFGVPVSCSADVGDVFPAIKIENGESVLDVLKRVLGQRELLAVPDGTGGIELIKVGQKTADAVLEQGVNILSANVSLNCKERFSDYCVHGQRQGNDRDNGLACSVKGAVRDEEIQRYRPLLIRSGQQGSAEQMRRRARWEMVTRRAKGSSLAVRTAGWRMPDGKLWPLGQKVRVKLPWFDLDKEMLIAGTVFTLSLSGTTTDLTLKEPDAYAQEPDEAAQNAEGAGAEGTGSADNLSMYVQQSRAAKAAGEKLHSAL